MKAFLERVYGMKNNRKIAIAIIAMKVICVVAEEGLKILKNIQIEK